jgi:hypothetical protein
MGKKHTNNFNFKAYICTLLWIFGFQIHTYTIWQLCPTDEKSGHPDFNLTTVLNDVVPDVTRMHFYSIAMTAFTVT